MARPTKEQIKERNKKKRGRPTKLDVGIINKLKEAFAYDCTVEEACFYAEINKTTYYAWLKENPDLSNEFERLRQKPILLARQTVINKMKDDGKLALAYLERKRKNEFSLRTEVANSGEISININTNADRPEPKDS